jgi:hypothetical protein
VDKPVDKLRAVVPSLRADPHTTVVLTLEIPLYGVHFLIIEFGLYG